MITTVSIILFLTMICFFAMLDMFILQQSFSESLAKLLGQEKGTKEWMINGGLVIGVIWSLVTDYRLHKQAKNS